MKAWSDIRTGTGEVVKNLKISFGQGISFLDLCLYGDNSSRVLLFLLSGAF